MREKARLQRLGRVPLSPTAQPPKAAGPVFLSQSHSKLDSSHNLTHPFLTTAKNRQSWAEDVNTHTTMALLQMKAPVDYQVQQSECRTLQFIHCDIHVLLTVEQPLSSTSCPTSRPPRKKPSPMP
jgi:hypothetical protein